MTGPTAFAIEYRFSFLRQSVSFERIRRRLERIEKKSQSIELVVAVPSDDKREGRTPSGLRHRLEIDARGNESAISGEQIYALVKGCIAHQISDVAVTNKTGLVQVPPFAYSNQIGNLGRTVKPSSVPGLHSRWNRLSSARDVVKRHLFELQIRMGRLEPGHIV
jgi:hypothetical protein